MMPEEFDKAVDDFLERLLDLPAAEQQAALDRCRAEQPEVCSRAASILERRQETSFRRFFPDTICQNHPAPPAPVATKSDAWPSIPGYEILEVLGRGGMGVVYKARDEALRRVVALKMLLAEGHAGDQDRARFRTEREAVAGLQHPNIVQIYGTGVHNGLPYFSMEYVEGGSLDRKIRGAPLPPPTAAHLIALLAQAMQAAHEKGILHRDLKPANVFLMPSKDSGGVPIDDPAGQSAHYLPKVADFGLAKMLDAESGLTHTGIVMGTPSYMAPEQASGLAHLAGPAADVWALGAILYECLTGRPPFKGRTLNETLDQVLTQEPPAPRVLQRNVPRDLETICLKCLCKEPERRYASAAALAEDLQRYRNGDSIQARSSSVFDRLTRALDRSHHDVAFHTWSSMVLLLAAIVFVEHLAVYLLIGAGADALVTWTRLSQFVLIGLVLWHNRGQRLLPSSASERQLWSIWIGYVVGHAVSALVLRALIGQGRLARGPTAPAGWEKLALYPFSAVLSGLAFFVMGSDYWGRCYAAGLVFFALALLMTNWLTLAPLAFGVLWAGTLVALGLRLRRLGHLAESKQPLKP